MYFSPTARPNLEQPYLECPLAAVLDSVILGGGDWQVVDYITKFQKRDTSLASSAWKKQLDDRMKFVRDIMLEEKGTQDRSE